MSLPKPPKYTREERIERRRIIAINSERTPLRAIRAHCLACSGNSLAEVKACRVTLCALHHLRARSL